MIYLVLNIADIKEPFVLYICKDEETAQINVDKVKENFVKSSGYNSKDEVDFIEYIALDLKSHIIWSAYDYAKNSL